ncbi:5-oxoprolinase subunit B family protein [Gulosibacter molinativorax]|uniref:Allophanate hydrolase n=1 Tax=Gulosibacter molinativorax TaxID=256821 RepID=A0ABT7CA85_9MICO|nr:carboxyltransferase domain-containing protein [Gulosibacter molinativorax]MDJ1372070.1 allophanate hydrolase [Gulosibacter molinativorax]QUY63881.1 Kinase A inhibitor [Gulosibacter molinativorax]
MTLPEHARYTWGGDEFLVVEIAPDMSLEANFVANSIATRIEERELPGIVDICPANASLLIRFNPDELPYMDLERHVRDVDVEVRKATEGVLETRVFEVPVWYDDPYTRATGAKFREGYHQDPSGTDLEYAAHVNGLADAQEFVRRHHERPWIVSMVGFVAGLPFLYQLAPLSEQLEVPKYLSPRTDTPPLTVGIGGCFTAHYSVRGAGGYQMLGIAPAPIYDPEQKLADFTDFSVLFKTGDIVKYRPVNEAEYREIEEQVQAGTYRYKQASVTFSLTEALDDIDGHNRKLLEALNVA